MAAVVDKRRDSLSQVAYDQIKTMILQKDLTPGQFINESAVSRCAGPPAALLSAGVQSVL